MGKTDKHLIIASTIDSDEGSYTCQISTYEGSVMSYPASIKVVSAMPRSIQSQQEKPRKNHSNDRHGDRHSQTKSSSSNSGVGMYGLKGRGIEDDVISQPVNTTVPSPAQKCKTHHIYIYILCCVYVYIHVLLTSRPIGTYADIKREARGREAPEGERFISAYVPSI